MCKVVIYNYFVLALIPCQIWLQFFFNLMYSIFYMGFLCKGCVWERVWRLKAKCRAKKISWVAHEKPSREVKHVISTWLECEESWQMVTVGFHECLAGKAFPRDTHQTFCFANLLYLTHPVPNHTIYTHITYRCWGVVFREKALTITLESERFLYPQFFT